MLFRYFVISLFRYFPNQFYINKLDYQELN